MALVAAVALGGTAAGVVIAGSRVRIVPVITAVEVDVTVPPAAPAAQVAPPAAPPARVRAAAPRLDARCLLAQDEDAACAWDDGFPAISADGALLATKSYASVTGAGRSGLAIRFIDARTSRIVRTVTLLSSNDSEVDPGDEQAAEAARLRVERAVAQAQQQLDARRFRSLISLGTSDDGLYDDPAAAPHPSPRRGNAVYVEFSGENRDAMRIVDPVANRALWQYRSPRRAAVAPIASSSCDDPFLERSRVWWDAETRTVLLRGELKTGMCTCPVVDVDSVHHMR